MKFWNVSLISLTMIGFSSLVSTLGFAEEDIKCDHEQSYCVTKNRRLIYGDKVGIFNSDNEVVAIAEVTHMEGENRKLVIKQRNGQISKGQNVRLLDENVADNPSKIYKIYKQPTKIKAGLGLGIANMNLAEEVSTYVFDAFGDYRYKGNWHFVGRLNLATASGVAIDPDNDNQRADFTVNAFNVLPGVAYEAFRKEKVSIRGELDVGFTYVQTEINAVSQPKSLDKIEPGFGLAWKGEVSAIYNDLGQWYPMASAGMMQIQNARAVALSAGVMKEIK